MADDSSDDFAGEVPIVPHDMAGVNCRGTIVADVEGSNAELRV